MTKINIMTALASLVLIQVGGWAAIPADIESLKQGSLDLPPIDVQSLRRLEMSDIRTPQPPESARMAWTFQDAERLFDTDFAPELKPNQFMGKWKLVGYASPANARFDHAGLPPHNPAPSLLEFFEMDRYPLPKGWYVNGVRRDAAIPCEEDDLWLRMKFSMEGVVQIDPFKANHYCHLSRRGDLLICKIHIARQRNSIGRNGRGETVVYRLSPREDTYYAAYSRSNP